MKTRLRLAFMFVSLSILCQCQGGCEGPLITNLVTITYRQVGNFNEWNIVGTNGQTIAKGKIDDGVFMHYRIVSIKNADSKPTVFQYRPNKIYASSDPSERPVNPSPVIGLSGSLGFDVDPGETFSTPPIYVTIKAKGNPAEIKGEAQSLSYESSAGEHVLMVNENPTAVPVPFLSPLTKYADLK